MARVSDILNHALSATLGSRGFLSYHESRGGLSMMLCQGENLQSVVCPDPELEFHVATSHELCGTVPNLSDLGRNTSLPAHWGSGGQSIVTIPQGGYVCKRIRCSIIVKFYNPKGGSPGRSLKTQQIFVEPTSAARHKVISFRARGVRTADSTFDLSPL